MIGERSRCVVNELKRADIHTQAQAKKKKKLNILQNLTAVEHFHILFKSIEDPDQIHRDYVFVVSCYMLSIEVKQFNDEWIQKQGAGIVEFSVTRNK